MIPSLLSEIRLFLVLSGMLFLPGSALLVVSGTWRTWQGLQRYIVAAGISVAFYPVLFYTMRFWLPWVPLGPPALGMLLLGALLITIWGIWKHRAFTLSFNRMEWAALAVIALTFASRFWVAHTRPFPAWSDSLHHTLLTDLTASQQMLPYTLKPYFPNELDLYHLGLYALSGTAQMLARVPAHTALLWTAQFLNSMCGFGVYLVLARRAGPLAAVVGTAVAGLFSTHPALYVNWGRFTQLSAQVILLIAWAITLEALARLAPASVDDASPATRRTAFWFLFLIGLTTAAIFLLHFRVALFYLLLLLITGIAALRRAGSRTQRFAIIKTLSAAALVSLLLILPTLWAALGGYLVRTTATTQEITAAQEQQVLTNYYIFPLSTVPYLAAPVWLLVTTAVGALIGLVRRNPVTIAALVWSLLLVALGNLYLLNVPVLNVTNLGAILIMLYLPMALVIGAGAETAVQWVPAPQRRWFAGGLTLLVIVAGLPAARERATTIEPHRFFITGHDLAAMEWINANLPETARFAINTYFWLPNFAHGTDAGYWIPYWTGREIVTTAMLSDGLSTDYLYEVAARAAAAEKLEQDLSALDELLAFGVEYIYIGERGDFSGPGLQLDLLTQSDKVEILFARGDAAVLRIHEPE